MKRSHYCNEVREHLIGDKVVLFGWVNRRRDHGGVIFVDLRDRSGLVQVVFSPERNPAVHQAAHELRNEYVLAVEGTVDRRPAETENPKMDTGLVEVNVERLEIVSRAKALPFQLDEEVNENVRLTHRAIDLRRPEMQRNLIFRHRVMQTFRQALDGQGFLEIETPMLTKSTPEGARDYLVPSRVNPGHFYALPQSPQLFKQLLMISGYDRYFQITRCFRDEDLRADRQPEFTQVDLEMSFVRPQQVMEATEHALRAVFKAALNRAIPDPIPQLPYAEAMERYGRDAPDLRIQLELVNLTEIMKNTGFKVFAQVARMEGYPGQRGVVKALRVPGGTELTRKQIDEYTKYVEIYGAKGLAWIKINGPWQEDKWQSPIVKFFSDEEKAAIEATAGLQTGDIIFFGADREAVVNEALGRLRVKVGKELGLMSDEPFAFVWITDFPLLMWDPELKQPVSVHHPFTSPRKEDLERLESDPMEVRAQAYDIVLNGTEIGGGSIRIHDPALQRRMFHLLGIDDEEAEEKFGFLLRALEYGAPIHGGLALGLDRLVALMLGLDSIREVIAFPKTQKATCALTQAPSTVAIKQLQELYLRSTWKPRQGGLAAGGAE